MCGALQRGGVRTGERVGGLVQARAGEWGRESAVVAAVTPPREVAGVRRVPPARVGAHAPSNGEGARPWGAVHRGAPARVAKAARAGIVN